MLINLFICVAGTWCWLFLFVPVLEGLCGGWLYEFMILGLCSAFSEEKNVTRCIHLKTRESTLIPLASRNAEM